MSMLTVEGDINALDAALMKCCESRSFQINDVSSAAKATFRASEQNPYASALAKISDIAAAMKIEPEFKDFSGVALDTAEDFETYCTEKGDVFTKIKKEYDGISSSLEEHQRTAAHIKHLLGMNVRFSDLFNMHYVEMRIGRLPAENLHKLDYYENRCICFIPFETNADHIWGIYLAPKDQIEFADMVMNSLYFERTRLPDYLVQDANTTDKLLENIIHDEQVLCTELETELAHFTNENKDELITVMSKLKYKYDCFELRKKALIAAGHFSFTGYCPTRESKELVNDLETLNSIQVLNIPITSKDATPEVPVKLRNNFIVRPFEMFVKMYGLPSYGDFDPTPYVAVTYMLMFGIMFGDVGQGLVISLLGLILSKLTKNGLAPIMTRIGLFSAAFGVVYGSVFGIETLIPPFFHREAIWKLLGYTEQPESIFQVATVLLIAALAIGIVLILISMIFNTVLNFRRHNLGEALFSVNGIAGIVFYGSLIAAAAGMFMLGINLFNPIYIICLIALPLVLIFFKHPLSDLISGKKHGEKMSIGNFIIENFIDLFEACLSYLSNTMSFLRIGGFILSHAGMMLVVAQLAGTHEPGAEITVGTIITYIIGNLIVMGVEGLLVGIQILRLEFYEIFNRFYSGSGQSFRPIEIAFEAEN